MQFATRFRKLRGQIAHSRLAFAQCRVALTNGGAGEGDLIEQEPGGFSQLGERVAILGRARYRGTCSIVV